MSIYGGEILKLPGAFLEGYVPGDEKERLDLQTIREFVASSDRPFDASTFPKHLTGSALIVSSCGTRVLFGYHRKLQRWLQMGGHGEPGELHPEEVAMREAREESGIQGLVFHPEATRPLDMDVHVIPARKEQPEHYHLDIRYLVVAPEGAVSQFREQEHTDLKWFTFGKALELPLDPALRRFLAKAQQSVCTADQLRGTP